MRTVAKFGGSSLSDAVQIRKVQAIVKSDSARHAIVVSAPGKRYANDQKITDLLYEWHRLHALGLSTTEVRGLIQGRFQSIVDELGLALNVAAEFRSIDEHIQLGYGEDYVASRGEYLNAKIVAEVLNYEFLDAATYLTFDDSGNLEVAALKERLQKRSRFVIPGFYGALSDGQVKTFSRGGSDLTGAYVAAALQADLYENWTDVSGLLMANPQIVESPKRIVRVTYHELRELSYMGANVFHEEAMFPVQRAGIATNIRNTNDPHNEGTYIVAEQDSWLDQRIVTGIAGKKQFTVLTIEKSMMNQEIGFARKVLTVLEQQNISFEHMPGGIDTLSVIIDTVLLKPKLSLVIGDINRQCQPDSVSVLHDLAMIAIVGRGMLHTPGVAAAVCQAVAEAGVNLRMINQGSSEINIIIGVDEKDFETAIRAIYQAFVP